MAFDNDMKATADSAQRLQEAFKKAGSEATAFKEALEGAVRQGQNLIDATIQYTTKNAEAKKYVIELQEGYTNVDDRVKQLTRDFSEVEKVNAKMVDHSREFLSLIGDASKYMGVLGDVSRTASNGINDMVKGVAQMATNPTSGFLGVVGGIMDLVSAASMVDKYYANMNRSIYDTNAALGRMGEYSQELVAMGSKLGQEYGKMPDEVDKLMGSLAKMGTSQENLYRVTDAVLELSTKWKDLTPEKQIAMMSQYMDTFGMSSAQAQNTVRELYNHAAGLKGQISELSIEKFMNEVTNVAVNVRKMGFEFKDAESYVAAITSKLGLGAGTEALKLAGSISQSFMSYGEGNLPLQAFMMQKQMPQADIFTQLGTWVHDPGVRTQAQVTTISEMAQKVGGGDIRGMDQEKLAGVFQLAMQQGLLPKLSERELQEVTKGGGAKLESILEKIKETAEKRDTKIPDTLEKVQGHTKDIVSATTSLEEMAKIWTTTKFLRSSDIITANIKDIAVSGGDYKAEIAKLLKVGAISKEDAGVLERGATYEIARATGQTATFEGGVAPTYWTPERLEEQKQMKELRSKTVMERLKDTPVKSQAQVKAMEAQVAQEFGVVEDAEGNLISVKVTVTPKNTGKSRAINIKK